MPYSVILEETRSSLAEERASSESCLENAYLMPEKRALEDIHARDVGDLTTISATTSDAGASSTTLTATPSSLAHPSLAPWVAEVVDFFRAECDSVRKEMFGVVRQVSVSSTCRHRERLDSYKRIPPLIFYRV